MKDLLRNITIKFITFLMISILGMLIANKAIFLHVHKLNDGTVINHAHHYDKSNDSKPFKFHNHTNAEILFFQFLEILFLVVFSIFALFKLVEKEKFSYFIIIRHTLTCIILHKGRAPPIS
jgi:hypothetical protein